MIKRIMKFDYRTMPLKSGGQLVMFEPVGLYARDLYASQLCVPLSKLQKNTETDAVATVALGSELPIIEQSGKRWVTTDSGEIVGRLTSVADKACTDITGWGNGLYLLVTKIYTDKNRKRVTLGGIIATRSETSRLHGLLSRWLS